MSAMSTNVFAIQTKTAKLVVSAMGAELKSWQPDGHTEYLHQPDRQWNGQAPLLFPVVGGLYERKYLWCGKYYPLPKHGFLKDRLFNYQAVATYQTEDKACLCLSYISDENDLIAYPFSFQIQSFFYLQANSLKHVLQITNLSSSKMPFACGFHPAFNLPRSLGTKVSDFAIRFPKKNSVKRLPLDFASGLQLDKPLTDWPLKEHTWEWQTEDFANDCWFFQTDGSEVELFSKLHQKTILSLQSDLKVLGIWQPYQPNSGSDFICIEPWSSSVGPFLKIADLGTWADRLSIEPGETCTLSYTVKAFL